jgi:hypothetical protein
MKERRPGTAAHSNSVAITVAAARIAIRALAGIGAESLADVVVLERRRSQSCGNRITRSLAR